MGLLQLQNLVNLRKINLKGSKYLMELPDLSTAQNLEHIRLDMCESLSHLDPSILSLPKLYEVLLMCCGSLKTLKSERQSQSIKTMFVIGCSFKEFSFSSNRIDDLDLGSTPIEILNFPIGHMKKLQQLDLDCSKLKNLPINDMICSMRSLVGLHLYDFDGVIDKSKLHTLFDSFISLESISLIGSCKLTELPHNIKHLSRLKNLNVSNCEGLQSLPEHLLYLRSIDLSNCRSLRSLPKLPFFIKNVVAGGCISLENIPNLATLPYLGSLSLNDCFELENRCMKNVCFPLMQAIYARKDCRICYPGRKVPKWMGIDASNITFIELPSTTTDLIGFVLCCVLSRSACGYLNCQLYYDGKKHRLPFSDVEAFDSHHVCLWSVFNEDIDFGKTIDDQNNNYRPELLFEFSFARQRTLCVDDVIEACGVFPIYASKYPKFIQQMELEANVDARKETCQDADENSFHGILKYAKFSLKTGKCGNLEGNNIPEWFTCKNSRIDDFDRLVVSFQLTPDLDKLMGFVFCFVIPNFSSKERDQYYSYFKCESENWMEYWYDSDAHDNDHFFGSSGWHYSMIKLNSDNVFLWYNSFFNECILKHLQRRKGCDTKLDVLFSFKLSYELIDFWWSCDIDGCLIKECGVRPIYVSEYTDFLQQEKLKVSMRTKRHRNINDYQQQLPSTKKVKDSSIDQSIPMNSDGLDKFWNQVYKRRARPSRPSPTSDTTRETTSSEAEGPYRNI